jgi:hypothetical protein
MRRKNGLHLLNHFFDRTLCHAARIGIFDKCTI